MAIEAVASSKMLPPEGASRFIFHARLKLVLPQVAGFGRKHAFIAAKPILLVV